MSGYELPNFHLQPKIEEENGYATIDNLKGKLAKLKESLM